MSTLFFALNAILPILILILLGYSLKKIKFLNDDFFKVGNKFVFRVALPCLLFYNIYNIDSLQNIDISVIIYSEIIIILFFIIGIVYVKKFISSDKQKGVILQCIFRSNYAIIGLPLAESLGGVQSIGIASVISAFAVPTFNILGVIALNLFINGAKGFDIKSTLKKIIKNPLIIGVLSGVFVLILRELFFTNTSFSIKTSLPFLYKALENISKIASPLALIILGGTFNFNKTKGLMKEIITGVTFRTVIVPLVGLSLAVILSKYTNILNLSTDAYPGLVALFASPVAVASAIMAQEMDNDGELAGQLVVWTSIVSIFTIFIIIVILKSLGLLM